MMNTRCELIDNCAFVRQLGACDGTMLACQQHQQAAIRRADRARSRALGRHLREHWLWYALAMVATIAVSGCELFRRAADGFEKVGGG